VGFGTFTILIAILMIWGIKDIIKIKNEDGPEALLRSATTMGNTPNIRQNKTSRNYL